MRFAVRLRSGALAVFSPTALTPEVKDTVASLGEVRYIAALDMEHHIFVGPWSEAYPSAKVIGPEGLPEKRAKSNVEDIKFDVLFTAKDRMNTKVDEEFDSEFDHTFVSSHGNKELVFNYRRDRTLIEADLLFNLPPTEQYSRSTENPHTGLLTKFFGAMNATSGSAIWQKRFIWYAISAADRTGFNKSMSKIDGWNFDRIIPCHGDVIESGGKGIFRKIMQWHLEAAEKN